MATPYTTIYTSFLDKISDQYLASMIDDDLKAQLLKYLNNAVPKFHKCKKNLSERTDEQDGFANELSDEEIEILANLMVVEWLRPHVNNLELLKQALTPKDFKLTSQANHLKELQTLRRDTQAEISRLLVDYSYNNNSLDDLQ